MNMRNVILKLIASARDGSNCENKAQRATIGMIYKYPSIWPGKMKSRGVLSKEIAELGYQWA